ncbi:MAG: transcription-repair coupling factor [Treponema sp.]|jgi:transcription-repair coupling factor (superfamily II helicase)|nr:transcription-repair coupling factor [Treponema sp.]
MNTLSFNELIRKTGADRAVSAFISAVKEGKFPLEVEGSEGSFSAVLISHIYSAVKESPVFLIVPTESDARDIALDLEGTGLPFMLFPCWGTAPYRELSPLSAVFGERVKVLSSLAREDTGIVIIPQRALLNPLPPPEYIKSLLIQVAVGGKIDTSSLAKTLADYGYIRVPRVQSNGEFALRGEVLDIFMGGDEDAYRILFDFDKVESIKKFDPVNQTTEHGAESGKLREMTIRPLREVVWTDERIDALEKKLASFKEFSNGGREVVEELISMGSVRGEEMFFPFAFEKSASLIDYLGGKGILLLYGRERLDNTKETIFREYQGMYSQTAREKKNEYPLPERLILDFHQLIKDRKKTVSFMTIKSAPKDGVCRIELQCEPARSFFGNIDYMKDEFASLLSGGWHITVAAESEMQAQRIKMIFLPRSDADAEPEPSSSKWPCEGSPLLKEFSIMANPLTAGFSMPDIKLMLIQENEIFGRRKRPVRSLSTARSKPIDTFIELNPGDYIVHVNYGIGIFKGIERITALGHERDYIQLEYADKETVFVPVEQVNLVQRYIGSEGNPPRLDVMGSKSWENRKNRVKKSVEDIAEKLLELYSKRRQAQGFAFPPDSEWQTMFEAAFPFEETEDQLRCISEIKKDMESPQPMDRLVCGDVGYGKTEVAVRACFKAVMGGKQSAFLAPTTILVEQHYENFLERFSNFPVNVAMLSRFVDRKNTRVILEKLKNGEIDLLVGTHRIIQRDVQFKNLGFIVIDEEQRFGVKDKERLKELKTNVDCLTLSATPIPRTLHMSLVNIRDMSLLATAPPGRRPIETFVEEYDDFLIANAIRREVERGGQVFFLHNRIETLRETRSKIERLVPEMLVETAHGQMDAFELEDIMRRFIHGGFHVLVSTTIIENGIDIPNVNTIIIDRADKYGVSQLYQLRGRVGRSDRSAYAYLFYPESKSLSEIAMKRLQTISDFTELGSGFKIAMKDMEIRGAGNLLGKEQSGDIYSVGFDLYVKLLDEAVKRLENSNYEAETETLMELEYSGFIPDSYIDSPQRKMEIYKMIAGVREKDELERVYGELVDRFGPLPDSAESLLALAEIRIICRELAVSSIKERGGVVRVEFAKVARVKVDTLLRMMKESQGRIKLDPKKPNVLLLSAGAIGLKEKSEFIREKLSALTDS